MLESPGGQISPVLQTESCLASEQVHQGRSTQCRRHGGSVEHPPNSLTPTLFSGQPRGPSPQPVCKT